MDQVLYSANAAEATMPQAPQTEDILQFQTSNYADATAKIVAINNKLETIKKTMLPLIEVALLQLLKNSNRYVKTSLKLNISNDDHVDVEAIYFVQEFIALEVPKENIQKDAKKIFDRISTVKGCAISKCEIDCDSGNVTIAFRL